MTSSDRPGLDRSSRGVLNRLGPALVALAIVLSPVAGSAAEELAGLLRPYQEARAMARLGSLDGMAYQEATSPTGRSQPYASLLLLALPYSEELEAKLSSIQSRQRESGRTYTGAQKEIADAVQEYRSAVSRAGAPDLVKEAVSDAQGRFHFEVPAGRWLLLGWRETAHPQRAKPIGKREAGEFVDNMERAGYALVTYWMVQVEVEAGHAAGVRLHDRNVWISTVREDLRVPKSTPTSPMPQGKRSKH